MSILKTVAILIGLKSYVVLGIECSGWRECTGEDVESNDTVYCTGVESCYQSLNIESFDEDIYCTNYQSCAESVSIVTNNQSIFCDGVLSCSRITSGPMVANNVYCNAYKSCRNSFIGYAGFSVNCDGPESCYGTYIDRYSEVNVNGYRGISSGSILNPSVVRLNSQDAGDDLLILCAGEIESCVIECKLNGCENVNLIGNSIFIVLGCDNIAGSVACPNGIESPSLFVCPDDCVDPICPCDENPFCEDCNDSGCSKCQEGYFLTSSATKCVSCNDTFGPECNECSDWTGCADCDSGYIRLWDNDCGLTFCNPT